MALQNIPLLVPLLVVGLCMAFLGVHIWWNRRTSEARTLAVLMLAVSVWALVYMLELGSADLSVKLFWAKVKYFGVSVVPTAWLIFVLQYSGRGSPLKRRNLALLSIMPLVTLALVWTNEAHHLFWKSVSLQDGEMFSILSLPIGPALWFCALYNYILLVLGIFLMIGTVMRSPEVRRKQAAAAIVASLVPLGGNLLYSMGISPVPHLDLTPFLFAVTCPICAWALLRLHLVFTIPEVYGAVVRSMDDAVLVVDTGGRIVDLNPVAMQLLGLAYREAVGQPIELAFARWPDLAETCGKRTETRRKIIMGVDEARRQFELNVLLLHDRRTERVGRLITLRDVSEREKAESALKESEERYRMLVEQARDVICTIDLKTGIISGANDYAASMLGYELADVVDRMTFLEIVHPDDHENVAVRMQELVVERKRIPNFPLRLVKANGESIHVEVNASVVYDAEGVPETFFGVLRDVSEKVVAEQALKESEERYRVLVDHSLTAICLVQDGIYQFVNQRMCEMSGYSFDELTGMPFSQIVHPDDVATVGGIISRRMSGESPGAQYQFRTVRKDGEIMWVETFGAPIEYQGRPALLVNSVDITERRKAEEALRMTQFTVDHAPDPVYWMESNARFVYVNEAACRTLGYSREELLSMAVPDIGPDFPIEVWPDHWKELQQERTLTFETLHRTKDGRIFPVEITANLVEFMGKEFNCGVAHDISNRKEAELQIQKYNERYRALFEESRDCVFITSPQGAFLDINPAGVEMFGYSSREELLAADLRRDIYTTPQDRDAFETAIANRGFVKDYELAFKRKDGKSLNILVTANTVRDKEGAIVAYRGIMRDITDQKHLEAQLLQAQKMEGIGTLAGGIAHDFNNILGGILGYASFMKTKMDEDHPFYKYVDTIEGGAMRAAELTSQLLAFARGGKYETRPVNLNRIVDETLKLIGRTFDKSIEIDTDLHQDLPTVEADAGQMQQVLMNLCVNAGDAMPMGGRLVIETAVEEISEDYADRKPGADARAYVVLSVADDGIGMETGTLQRIFEPFFTTKEEGKGTGLGLSMVYGVIKNHDGFINVYSEPNEGTVFKVYLPASEQAETLQEPQADAPHGDNELILVVDDEESIRDLASDILETYGYRVLLASDGLEAVEIYEKRDGDISLVILDMVMPKMGGRETFLRMKELNPEVRALLSTGYSQNGKAREIIDSGAMGFVQKPYRVNSLLSAVRNVLDTGMTI